MTLHQLLMFRGILYVVLFTTLEMQYYGQTYFLTSNTRGNGKTNLFYTQDPSGFSQSALVIIWQRGVWDALTDWLSKLRNHNTWTMCGITVTARGSMPSFVKG